MTQQREPIDHAWLRMETQTAHMTIGVVLIFEQPLVWVPQAGNVGVDIAILTYKDIVQFGFVADTQLIADPDEIADLFITQFRVLEMLVDEALHVAAEGS
jgi:hypothetical protein